MNTTKQRSGADPFEDFLRRRLGPASRETPPSHLRQAILAQVAALPVPEPRFRLRPAVVASALAVAFLALAMGWLLTGPVDLLAQVGGHLHPALPEVSWRSGLGLLAGGGWLGLLRSPVALAVLPFLLLPLLYFLQDEH
ncbi:MAG: hypothetical protein Q8O14_03135 [bacterium]|jgi:hypothetical protein|nr:hypothetical protein [bacterium]